MERDDKPLQTYRITWNIYKLHMKTTTDRYSWKHDLHPNSVDPRKYTITFKQCRFKKKSEEMYTHDLHVCCKNIVYICKTKKKL